MPENSAFSSKPHLPSPGNPQSLAVGWEHWDSAISSCADPETESAAAKIARGGPGKDLLDAVFAHSPFLGRLAADDPAFTLRILADGADAVLTDILSSIAEAPEGETEPALKTRLRIAKKRAALTIALADIGGDWPLEKVTGGLSSVAETCLMAACDFCLRETARRGALELHDPDAPSVGSGLVVLGMGKLGARELNYSSDIDIIVLFDPEATRTTKPDELQPAMVRLVRQMLRIMDERTADGYVFRTDLRLRPDPSATPLAISVLAAENYYESLGQNWERAAMIKARAVAGDLEAGTRFLEWLRPFIWRKHLDFAAIQDIHSIKRQINAHRGIGAIQALGHNVKLGGGGIREIEFFAQTQQLIWGGRIPELRLSGTKAAIDCLVALEQVTPEVAADLKAAYDFLRQVEHRLQMVNDEQTHTLPDEQDAFDAFAAFMGYPTGAAFAEVLTGHLKRVQSHYGALFGDAPTLSAAADQDGIGGNLVFTGGDADPDTLATIRKMGFEEPARVDAQIRAWHHGRYRAMRSTRSRELLTELMPVLLRAIAATPEPDKTFLRFDSFLKILPGGVQLFSMFHSNPHLLSLVVEIAGKAPKLADHMGRHASILDSVLTADFFDPPPDLADLGQELDAQLASCRDLEDVLIVCRRWANDRRFQIGVQRLGARIAPLDASRALSDIAETALGVVLSKVADDFAESHGRIPGGEIAIVAMGRLGSREMTAASDLDLIFVYDADDDAEESDGDRPLAPAQYFGRLTQRTINAITAMMAEGPLYEVDMRLRPSGTKGPLATSLTAFRKYHDESAWTWERMALVRARAVAGTGDLRGRVAEAIASILGDPVDPVKLLRDAADMRARIAKEKASDSMWDIKNLRGGLVDIAFTVQYLTLRHIGDHPDIRDANTAASLDKLKAAGVLAPAHWQTLMHAQELWMGILGLLAETIEGTLTKDKESLISGALADDLVRVAGADDFDSLKRMMMETAQAVFNIYQELIDGPAADLPPAPDVED
ncbi:MAG: bifunctional [glutamate--ammonia ligase]-adenylyl-L-tyrosine phosphorylase/[glutamate--ammonia-ligase] adenylyltransferase [Rhodospirillaceae bacterium]|nr:bifunctional [glutamate--ammonia ligase]-adenylyl-L-tyrosine phosphorylase/[glutamate--ammonia-ligase] adenylyltransferase [Rhodospirillaceae bacterium]